MPASTDESMVSPSEKADERWISVGSITGCHGVKGALKIRPHDSHPDWLTNGQVLQVLPQNPALKKKHPTGALLAITATHHPSQQLLTIKFEGINDRTQADPWVGSELLIRYQDLPAVTNPNEIRAVDLMGLQVKSAQNPEGPVLATVDSLAEAKGSAQDFLQLKLTTTGKLSLVPFTEHFIPTIDREAGVLYLAHLDAFLAEEDTPKASKPKRPAHYRKKKRQTSDEQS